MLERLKSLDKQKCFIVIIVSIIFLSLISLFSKTAYTVIFYLVAICVAVFYSETESLIFWLICLFYEQTMDVLSLPLIALMLGISILKDIIHKKFKLGKEMILPIVLTLVLIVMCFAVGFKKDSIKTIFTYIIILVIALEFFYLRGRFDFNTISIFGSLILVSSCLMAFIMQFGDGFWIFHTDNNSLKRFVGLTTHENMLSTYAIMFMAYCVLIFFKKKIRLSHFVAIELILAVIGVLTLSKAFIILFAILGVFYFIKSFMVNKKSAAIQLGCFVVFVGLFMAIFHNKVESLFNRFFLYFSSRGFLDMITTGRWTIWVRFYWQWCAKLSNLFIGLGVSYKPNEYIHNFYFDIIFKFGLIGVLCILSLVIYYFSVVGKNKKFSLENFIPLFIALANMFIEVFIAKRILVFFIAIIGLFYLTEKDPAATPNIEPAVSEKQELEESE